MTKWQLAVVLAGVVGISAAVGYSAGRRTVPAAVPAKNDAKSAKKDPVAATATLPDPVSAAPAAADPADPVKAPVKKPREAARTSSGLPGALEKVLGLDATQSTSVAKIMADWNTKLSEISKKAMQPADKMTKEASAAMLDEWRQAFSALKNERMAALNGVFTPEQGVKYREYRDTQYQSWLDQKVSMFCSLTKYSLKPTDEQLAQIKPIVRSAYDDVTSGGTMVPLDAQRSTVKQVMHQRILPLLTPDQAKLMTQNEHSFGLDLW